MELILVNWNLCHITRQFFLKRKYSSISTTRHHKIGSKQNQMENELFQYIKSLQRNNQLVTRKIMFCRVIELLPMFKGEIYSSTFLKDAKNWFYFGFKPRYNLHYIIIYGASRKLSQGWEERVWIIITCVGMRHVPKVVNGTTINAIGDD